MISYELKIGYAKLRRNKTLHSDLDEIGFHSNPYPEKKDNIQIINGIKHLIIQSKSNNLNNLI